MDGNFVDYRHGKWVAREMKHVNHRVGCLSGERFTQVSTLEVNDVRGKCIVRQVIHSLIKTSMLGYFHTLGFFIIPQDVLCSVWKETEEETTTGMRFELCATVARRADPNAAAEGPKLRKVVSLGGSKLERRMYLIARRKRVLDA